VLTYHLGEDVHYQDVQIHRIPKVGFIRDVVPGFSMRKMLLDVIMFIQVFSLVLKNRYQVVHAVEESVFIALILKTLFRIPYIYDMDSSLSGQMIERYPRLFRPLYFVLNYAEGLAIRQALAVVPVCDALSEEIEKFNPAKVLVLRDVSLLAPEGQSRVENLREQFNIRGPLMMYVGNLESYQGIDLLLESFAMTVKRKSDTRLVIIGGKASDIERYRVLSRALGVMEKVHFLGPKPVERLSDYLVQADILVSPRIKGKNTPMKIYSYLDSGKALLATDLPTHTQVLNEDVAVLAAPTAKMFSSGVLRLVEDDGLRQQLGKAGKQFVAERHSYVVFRENLNALYDWLAVETASLRNAKHAGRKVGSLFSRPVHPQKNDRS
jgi:glycosyltransferase involved in cell wall biosynthesis